MNFELGKNLAAVFFCHIRIKPCFEVVAATGTCMGISDGEIDQGGCESAKRWEPIRLLLSEWCMLEDGFS